MYCLKALNLVLDMRYPQNSKTGLQREENNFRSTSFLWVLTCSATDETRTFRAFGSNHIYMFETIAPVHDIHKITALRPSCGMKFWYDSSVSDVDCLDKSRTIWCVSLFSLERRRAAVKLFSLAVG